MPGQEANDENLGEFFFYLLYNNGTHEAILMSTYNIQYHDKIRKLPLTFVFLSYLKNFIGTQKRV